MPLANATHPAGLTTQPASPAAALDQAHRQTGPSHRFCVAPMLDCTDRHGRMFLRLFSARALLYTEMITAAALRHGDAERLLRFSAAEQPVALQLGGSEPADLAAAARLGELAGYREINLNLGCPSARVRSGAFGACLMAEPARVADCIAAMGAATALPVTAKCRIGIDDQDSEAFLLDFVATLREAGCRTVIIHARKALLRGLSPKENREIPPLHYDRVVAVKRHYPDLEVIINGGIESLAAAEPLLTQVDGVMLGRAAYHNPYLLSAVDERLYGEAPRTVTRVDVLESFLPYVEAELARGTPLHHLTRHTLGLFRGIPGGRQYRRHLSEHASKAGAGMAVLREALATVAAATREPLPTWTACHASRPPS